MPGRLYTPTLARRRRGSFAAAGHFLRGPPCKTVRRETLSVPVKERRSCTSERATDNELSIYALLSRCFFVAAASFRPSHCDVVHIANQLMRPMSSLASSSGNSTPPPPMTRVHGARLDIRPTTQNTIHYLAQYHLSVRVLTGPSLEAFDPAHKQTQAQTSTLHSRPS